MTVRHAADDRHPIPPDIEAIGTAVVDAAYVIYNQYGSGLLERVYAMALADELRERSLHVLEEVYLPIRLKHRVVEQGLRLDLLVDGKVVVEVKSVEALHPVHASQMLTYLKFSGCELGHVLNFGSGRFPAGVRRFILTPPK